MKRLIYKMLSLSNDIKAVFNGRILSRLWNKTVGKFTRKLFR